VENMTVTNDDFSYFILTINIKMGNDIKQYEPSTFVLICQYFSKENFTKFSTQLNSQHFPPFQNVGFKDYHCFT
jgi:hypothetical protein